MNERSVLTVSHTNNYIKDCIDSNGSYELFVYIRSHNGSEESARKIRFVFKSVDDYSEFMYMINNGRFVEAYDDSGEGAQVYFINVNDIVGISE